MLRFTLGYNKHAKGHEYRHLNCESVLELMANSKTILKIRN